MTAPMTNHSTDGKITANDITRLPTRMTPTAVQAAVLWPWLSCSASSPCAVAR